MASRPARAQATTDRREALQHVRPCFQAVGSLRRGGRLVDDELLAHISPAHSENVNFFGPIEVGIDAELAQLGPTGYRPIRAGDTLF